MLIGIDALPDYLTKVRAAVRTLRRPGANMGPFDSRGSRSSYWIQSWMQRRITYDIPNETVCTLVIAERKHP